MCNALQAAKFEAHNYHLDPQAPGESDEDFCRRINREKTPKIVAKNMEIAAGLDAWNSQHVYSPPLAANLKKLMDTWLPKMREPGCDDE